NSPIAEMGGSLRRQSDRFRDYKLRCMMRDQVQAACRGRLRRWDHLAVYVKDAARAATAGPPDLAEVPSEPSGSLAKLIVPECGQQLLVCGIHEDAWLWENWKEMFPGAPLPVASSPKRGEAPAEEGRYKDWAGRLRELLAQPNLPEEVSTQWIGEQWGVKWGK